MDIENEVLHDTYTAEAEVEEGTEEAPKKELSPEQIAGIEKRQLTKLAKKYGYDFQKPEEKITNEKSDKDFDYGELAYLNSLGFKEEDEQMIIRQAMKSTGASLKDAAKDEFVVGKIKSQNEFKASEKAREGTSQGGKRTGTSTRDTVDYWVAKGGLPEGNFDLKKQIVAARMKGSKSQAHFTDRPVV